MPWQILAGLAATESGTPGQPQLGFNANDISDDNGAFGVMQIKPAGGHWQTSPFPSAISKAKWPLEEGDWSNPQKNICAGAAELSHWRGVFGSWTRALLCYKKGRHATLDTAGDNKQPLRIAVQQVFDGANSLGGMNFSGQPWQLGN